MVDLADRRVLAEQQPVALAEFGDVAHEQQAAVDLRRIVADRNLENRHATTQQRDVAALFELLDDRLAAFEGLAHGPVVESQFGEPHADRVRLDPDAVQRGVGVRGHVRDGARVVDGEDAVTDAWRGARIGDAAGEREQSGFDHAGELLERDRVVAFEVAGDPAGAHVPLLAQHGDRATVVADRNRQHPPGRRFDAVGVDLALDLDPTRRRRRQDPRLRRVGPRPHVVGRVHRLVRGRTDLVDHEPPLILGLDVEQQIGETEVGQKSPLGDEAVQVVDVVAAQCRVLA